MGGHGYEEVPLLRTRIRRVVAVVIASAAIGGVLAGPASASPPQFLVVVDCEALGAPVTVVVLGDPGIQRVIGQLAKECDRGTMRVSVERL
jgi:hypothetical protein